jgi:hypothetical protein
LEIPLDIVRIKDDYSSMPKTKKRESAGRPKLDGTVIWVRVDDATHAALKKISDEAFSDTPIASVAREVLKKWAGRQK